MNKEMIYEVQILDTVYTQRVESEKDCFDLFSIHADIIEDNQPPIERLDFVENYLELEYPILYKN